MKTFLYPSYTALLALFITITLTGCDGFVDVDLPSSQLTGSAVFQDRATANAALVDIYSRMRDGGFLSGNLAGATVSLGFYADELDYYGPAADAPNLFYQNSLLDSQTTIQQNWNLSYAQIYAANAVLEGLENSPIAMADRNQFRGEALFIRSILHFYLTNTYGNVPLITTTDYQLNRHAHRQPIAEVYARIIDDLEEATALLPQTYVTSGRVRPNRSTVFALLSKVYLYNGQWAEAANAASAVLNESDYSLDVPSANVFLKASPSTIWQFNPRLEGINTDFGTLFIFNAGPPPYAALTPGLVSAFEPGDQRRVSWVREVTTSGMTWQHAAKYDQNAGTGTSLEFPIVFRAHEVYLIRAEARARQGELTAALQDLNAVRAAAGLGVTTAVGQAAIIESIMRERRVELFAEYGNRFYDLKRTGNLDAVLESQKPGWDTTDALWPLPASELISNSNLAPQNPGY